MSVFFFGFYCELVLRSVLVNSEVVLGVLDFWGNIAIFDICRILCKLIVRGVFSFSFGLCFIFLTSYSFGFS